MNWFLAGWVLVLQTAFWGLGLTLLLLPRRWRRFWPAFVGPVGLALQSAVVWAGAHTTLPGTDSYALASLLGPVGCLAGAFWRDGVRATVARLAAARRWWLLVPILSVSLGLQIWPFTKPPGTLTVVTLGSCDAADYAAGARVFKEFSSRDRTGYLGQPEQVRGLSVDNFYDFWLRINHFTPSALLALNASLLRRQPYELTSLLGIVLILLNLPTVFWMARALFRFRPLAAGIVTFLYGCSPVVLYAMCQVALGQLIAAPAVATILWTCLQADRAARRGEGRGRLWAWFGLLLAGNSLLLGAYNFFVIFAYVPLVAFVGGRVLLRRRGWGAAGRLAALIAVNLLACAILFPERVIGLGERFLLFKQTAFGWRVSGFRPDGWYGAFGSVYLHPAPGWAPLLGAGCLAALAWAAFRLVRSGRGRTVGLAAACVLPIFCGYGILLWEDAAGVRQNASYDAYKMFAVFYPLILPALCLFLAVGLRRTVRVPVQAAAAALAAVLVVVNLQGAWRCNAALRQVPVMVSPGLSELAALENTPGIDGVNIRVRTVWDALWASQFLLHKRQFITQPTYEGRAVLPPRGRWDLVDRFTAVEPGMEGENLLAGDEEFALLDRQSKNFLEVRLLGGWHELEEHRGEHWCWAAAAPTVQVVNPHPEATDAQLQIALRSLHPREVRLYAGTTLVWTGQTGSDGARPQQYPPVAVRLPPGESRFRFETSAPPDRSATDARALTFALYGFQVHPSVAPTPAAHP